MVSVNKENFCKRINFRYSIPNNGSGMTWVSERNPVSSISNAGGFGILACGSMNVAQLDEEIKLNKKMTKKYLE